MESITWLILIIILVGFELATMGLTTIWFAAGALIAFVAALCGAPLELQIGLFLVISFVILLAFRPWAMRFVNNRHTRTNADSLVGQTALITLSVDNGHSQGTAVVNGQEWSARSEDGSAIPAGSTVRIQAISGVKLIVKKEEK